VSLTGLTLWAPFSTSWSRLPPTRWKPRRWTTILKRSTIWCGNRCRPSNIVLSPAVESPDAGPHRLPAHGRPVARKAVVGPFNSTCARPKRAVRRCPAHSSPAEIELEQIKPVGRFHWPPCPPDGARVRPAAFEQLSSRPACRGEPEREPVLGGTRLEELTSVAIGEIAPTCIDGWFRPPFPSLTIRRSSSDDGECQP